MTEKKKEDSGTKIFIGCSDGGLPLGKFMSRTGASGVTEPENPALEISETQVRELDVNELNRKIEEICDNASAYEAFAGKCVPYIGWFWRFVNFDDETYRLGVLPLQDGTYKAGFMENNKWGYANFETSPEQALEIRRRLNLAVQRPTRENLASADEFIQRLLSEFRILSFRNESYGFTEYRAEKILPGEMR